MTKTQCTNGQDHKEEYHSTQEGRLYSICWLCGDVTFEFEDNQAGG